MNNFLWLLLALLALALSWFAESALLAWGTLVLLFILFASRILVRFAPCPQASRTLSTNYLQRGEKVRVWVRLNMPRRPWGWMMVTETTPPLPLQGNRGILLHPAAAKQAEFAYTLQGTRRGYFSVGPLSLRCGDPFGFAEQSRPLLEAENITVFPRILGMGRMRLPVAPAPGELPTMRRTFEDPARPAGIRAYRQGDALRRIHWRATAHTGRPQAKLYDVSTSLQALLALNLCRPDYPPGPVETVQASELAISLAASLSIYLLSSGQRVGLFSNGLDVRERDEILQEAGVTLLPESQARLSDELASRRKVFLSPSRSPERPLEILSLLARLQVARGRSLASLLGEVRAQLCWGDTVILITPSVDGPTLQSLVSLTHAGFSVLALVVGDSPLATRAHLRLAAAYICSQRVMCEEDIGGLFT